MALPLSFRWDEGLVADIDRVRGDVPRSAWVRRLCQDAIAAHDALRPDREMDKAIVREAVESGATHVKVEAGSMRSELPEYLRPGH